MASRQEEITQAILARLTDGLPSATPPILPLDGMTPPHRSPTRPLDDEELPTFVVVVTENSEDDRDAAVAFAEGAWRRCAWVWVEFRGLAPSSDIDGAVDKACDPWVDYAMSVLLSDQQLGGLCDMIEPDRVMYEGWQGQRTYVTAAMLFRVYYIASPI
jgi:hypothetical protein